jgi:hypothetical protein
MKNLTFLLIILLSFIWDSTELLGQEDYDDKVPVYETFRTIYLVNGHSSETLYPKDLMVNISHRFGGYTSDGIQDFFGLDFTSNIRLELMYGITEALDVGIGRSSFNKLYDGTVKYRLVQQMEQGFPMTLTFLGNAAVNTEEWSELEKESLEFRHRVSYRAQMLVASKLTPYASIQFAPTYIHRNLVSEILEENQLFSLGVAASVRLFPTISLKAEYYHRFSEGDLLNKELFHPFGISLDISNERHSYQIQLTNNTGLIGQEFIPDTRDDFFGGQIHIGFRIIRKFALSI